MTIKVKQKSEDLITIRCNNENEMRFVLGMFAELKHNDGLKITVKNMRGDEISVPKYEPPQQQPQKTPIEISEEMDRQKEQVCPECGGKGEYTYQDGDHEHTLDCVKCNGTGKSNKCQ